ncbi:MAG: glycosyltransferase [Hahellaceae bacterium]|nr:glycosyltransferase [Hahellaceae bacterium]
MRILLFHFYSPKPNPAYFQIAGGLAQLGHDVYLANQTDDKNLDIALVNNSVPPQRLSGPYPSPEMPALIRFIYRHFGFLLFIFRLRTFIRKNGVQIVLCNPGKMKHMWALALLMPASIRFIYDCRQVPVRKATTRIRRLKMAIKSHTRLVTLKYIYDHATYLHHAGAMEDLGANWKRWGTVVPLGISETFLTENRAVPDHKESNHPTTFIYIGSITRIRKLDLLIEAAQDLKEQGVPFRLDLVGPDTSDGYYQKLVAQYHLEDCVHLCPAIRFDDIPKRICEYDVALAYVPDEPQDWKFQPTLKVLEYQALGIPMIATEVMPNREIIERSYGGLLVKNTAKQWSNAMQQCADAAWIEQATANAQRHRIGTTWNDVAKCYESLFEKLIRNHG